MFFTPSSTDSSHLRYFHSISNFISFSIEHILYGLGVSVRRPTHNLEGQDILSVWVITFDWSDKGGLTIRYATGSTVFRIILPRNPHQCVKVGIPFRGKSLQLIIYSSFSFCSYEIPQIFAAFNFGHTELE